jgi:hypothetical protein
MQRVIGIDIHRSLADVVFWEAGRLRPGGRIDMTRSGHEGFGRSLSKQDEVVVEATAPEASSYLSHHFRSCAIRQTRPPAQIPRHEFLNARRVAATSQRNTYRFFA